VQEKQVCPSLPHHRPADRTIAFDEALFGRGHGHAAR
jgi:hypothetical protein